jgi:hypothetical protein
VAKKRGRETALDMLRSMAVLFVFIAFILLVTWRPWVSSSKEAIDYRGTAIAAEKVVGFNVKVPTLPSGWTVNAARYERAPDDATKYVWTLAIVTSDAQFINFQQTNTALIQKFVRTITGGTEVVEPTSTFQVFANQDGVTDTAVQSHGDSVLVITYPKEVSIESITEELRL